MVPTEHERSSAQDARGADLSQPPPSKRQVAGNHYAHFEIQPSEFIHRNKLGWCEGNAIKYICRHPYKHGRDDILKAIHYLELLLEWEYPEEKSS